MPRLPVPPGACDTHVHIFDAAAIAASGARAAPASLADYLGQRQRLGISRTVLVQPSAFKFDNTGVLAALAQLGDTARAVVSLERATGDAELARLTRLNVRGARFHLLKSTLQSWDDVAPMAELVAPHGWHIQLQCDGRELPDRLPLLSRLTTTLVVDQTGKFVKPVPVTDPAFKALLRLVEQGNTYVKLSAPYEVSAAGPPDYDDVSALARALVAAAPERMLWASNWPHHALPPGNRPDDADLLNLLGNWAPDPHVQHQILVDNPARVYGFGEPN